MGNGYLEYVKRVLSIFIDESGDLNAPCYDTAKDAFYIISLVFHNQTHDITQLIENINVRLNLLGLSPIINDRHSIHSYNLIRNEPPYSAVQGKFRLKLFRIMLQFMKQSEKEGIAVRYVIIDRREYKEGKLGKNRYQVNARSCISAIREGLKTLIVSNRESINRYDIVKIYYDNGQSALSNIINEVFLSELSEGKVVRKEKVCPQDYKLFQMADMACTLTLLSKKVDEDALTSNDRWFFEGRNRETPEQKIRKILHSVDRIFYRPLPE